MMKAIKKRRVLLTVSMKLQYILDLITTVALVEDMTVILAQRM